MARSHDRSTVEPAVPRVGNGSLAEQTTRALLEAIMTEQFPDGRLPPEPELAAQLAVSRTTVRAALQSLEGLGIVSRAPGRGTIVRSNVGRESVALQRLVGFRALLEERGHRVKVDQATRIASGASDDAAAALGLTESAPVLVVTKTFMADGQTAIAIEDQVPLASCGEDLVERLLAGRKVAIPDSIFEFSKTWPDRSIEYTIVEIEPRAAQGDEPGPLDLPAGTPYVSLAETHCTVFGLPVAFSRVHVDDRYLRFRLVRFA